MPELRERQRGRQPADTAPCNQDFHDSGSPRRFATIFLAAKQDVSPVAILALDKVLIAHLVPDFRVAKGPAAAIAGHLAAGRQHDFRWTEDITGFFHRSRLSMEFTARVLVRAASST